jgi:hypothetical protein
MTEPGYPAAELQDFQERLEGRRPRGVKENTAVLGQCVNHARLPARVHPPTHHRQRAKSCTAAGRQLNAVAAWAVGTSKGAQRDGFTGPVLRRRRVLTTSQMLSL